MDRIEERLAIIETDIKWIKENITEIKNFREDSRKLWYALGGSILTSVTAIIIALIKYF